MDMCVRAIYSCSSKLQHQCQATYHVVDGETDTIFEYLPAYLN